MCSMPQACPPTGLTSRYLGHKDFKTLGTDLSPRISLKMHVGVVVQAQVKCVTEHLDWRTWFERSKVDREVH